MSETDDAAFDLNTLMSLDPLSLSKQNLDSIIAYQRKQRAAREAGVKTKKDPGGNAVDIKALLGTIGKPKAEAEAKPKITLQDALKTSLKAPPSQQPKYETETKPEPKPTGFIRRF